MWRLTPSIGFAIHSLRIESAKVGYQNVSVQIADQEASFSAADEVLRTSCDDGYYGQEAWTPYMINGDIAYDQFEINGETAQDDYDIDDADDRIQWRNPYPNFT